MLAHRQRRWPNIKINTRAMSRVFWWVLMAPIAVLLQRAIVVICSAHLTANSQYQMLSEMGHNRDVGPALKQHWIEVTCLLV